MYRCGREGLSWKGVIKKYEKQKKKQISNEEKLEREEVAVVEEIQMALNLIYGRVRRWQKKENLTETKTPTMELDRKWKHVCLKTVVWFSDFDAAPLLPFQTSALTTWRFSSFKIFFRLLFFVAVLFFFAFSSRTYWPTEAVG